MAGVAIAAQGGHPNIVFFAISDRPIRASAAENVLAADPLAIDAAVATLAGFDVAADLNASAKMKRHLAGVVLRRAWEGMAP